MTFLWTLVCSDEHQASLTRKLNLLQTHEFVYTLQPGDDVHAFARMSAEELLLRWVNHHLALVGAPRRLNNFSSDLQVRL